MFQQLRNIYVMNVMQGAVFEIGANVMSILGGPENLVLAPFVSDTFIVKHIETMRPTKWRVGYPSGAFSGSTWQ